eukprot:4996721-Ditylum_brightwellii.AAC.1
MNPPTRTPGLMKKTCLFHREYREDTCLFWCQFEAVVKQVIAEKPCKRPEAKFGVTRACLMGKVLSNFDCFTNKLDGGETDPNYKEALMMLKEEIFDIPEMPRADQID